MAGFNFERHLPHQDEAVAAITGVFLGLDISKNVQPAMRKVSNPCITSSKLNFGRSVLAVQKEQGIMKGATKVYSPGSRVLDISMETGTGKTYTYAKAIFELNKAHGFNKFIVIVPTLSIKAGTVSFLVSDATKQHFKQDYQKTLKTHVVESQKSTGKGKKSYMPQAVSEFVEVLYNPSTIHVLVINAGMINSDTMQKVFDKQLFEQYDTPYSALASIKPITIIDEPHKFKKGGKTWGNIQCLNSQMTLRFGATFDEEYHNLIHELTAVDAFNQDLVKGIVTYVEQFDEGNGVSIKLLRLFRDKTQEEGKKKTIHEPVFQLNDNGKKSTFKLIKGESLSQVHEAMHGVTIEKHNKSVVELSNGVELKKGDTINPYSYAKSLQDKMMESAIKRHFELERKYLTRTPRIKPLTLFFIDDIEGYREGHEISGSLKTKFEALVKAQAERVLKTETNPFYKAYLERTLQDLSMVHGGYFSKDNSSDDAKVEKEIIEILHDKEKLLSLDNPRRFIFSKWTLREGWDNPNVFQICKLRSSGSQTSKLQEVGRGLRLPVNEHMSRVKDQDEKFELHYYVDFTEKNFTEFLINEINSKSGVVAAQETKLSDDLIELIKQAYPEFTEGDILETLDDAGAIKRNNDFKEGGFDILKATYPLAVASDGVKAGKVRSGNESQKKATLRVAKYSELKSLWETINQRVTLEYKIKSETDFQKILKSFFLDNKELFKAQGSVTKKQSISIHNDVAVANTHDDLDNEVMPLVTMSYKDFILDLARVLSVNIHSLHQVFAELQSDLDINLYLSHSTIRTIHAHFKVYLLDNSFSKYQISYSKVSNNVHPTVFTNDDGSALKEVNAAGLGRKLDDGVKPSDAYLFEEVFYDSDLEKENIISGISNVTVFTKIPKNSIRIPVAGGGEYSPDFAYVVEYEDGQKSLNLIVETKDTIKTSLRDEEKKKIKHAEKLFNSFDHGFNVSFESQFKDVAIKEVIKKAIERSQA